MSIPPATLEVGSVIGDYQIMSVIGRGGMGKVFKVRNLISHRVDAMKVLLPDLDPDPDLMQRFLREIRLVGSLEHPNIACLRTALRAGNQVLMIMEYVEGESVSQVMRLGRMDAPRAVNLTAQVLGALSYAHGRGVVHRDVKPSNVLVGPEDKLKLTDFGIASRSGDPKLTTAGSALGSLNYMSPEQMRSEPFDARSDIYSVGVTLYEMVTGQLPVPGKSFYAILRAHMEERPVPALDLVRDVTPELSKVLERALEKVPDARFQTAEEFKQALASLKLPEPTPRPAATAGFSINSVATAAFDAEAPTVDEPTPVFGAAAPPEPVFGAPAIPPPISLLASTPEPEPVAPAPSARPDTTSAIKLEVKSDTGSKSWDPAVLENVRKSLAVYVGPMAKILVNRAAKNSRTFEALCRTLAEEIASQADRENFLRSQLL